MAHPLSTIRGSPLCSQRTLWSHSNSDSQVGNPLHISKSKFRACPCRPRWSSINLFTRKIYTLTFPTTWRVIRRAANNWKYLSQSTEENWASQILYLFQLLYILEIERGVEECKKRIHKLELKYLMIKERNDVWTTRTRNACTFRGY